ncbi:hypothetical protein [Spirochaeta cellobiosiphila]|uniref:hypothetical protein n=1 Tax=Spirochaeta cellobiosiphila TaxID=504483 RepID=UPI00146CCCE9|nr:hypothetical protein [Spirochaeta cellobiosiphila]
MSGTWYRSANPTKTVEKKYGWGSARTVINFTLVIDGYKTKPTIFLPMIGGPFEIRKITKVSNNTYDLAFYFDRGNFDVVYRLHMLSGDSFWVEQISKSDDKPFIPTGEAAVYFRIDGPNRE